MNRIVKYSQAAGFEDAHVECEFDHDTDDTFETWLTKVGFDPYPIIEDGYDCSEGEGVVQVHHATNAAKGWHALVILNSDNVYSRILVTTEVDLLALRVQLAPLALCRTVEVVAPCLEDEVLRDRVNRCARKPGKPVPTILGSAVLAGAWKWKKTMANKLAPDPEQCQAELPDGHTYTRCTNKPMWIATDKNPKAGEIIGSMSVCGRCRERMEEHLPNYADFKELDKLG